MSTGFKQDSTRGGSSSNEFQQQLDKTFKIWTRLKTWRSQPLDLSSLSWHSGRFQTEPKLLRRDTHRRTDRQRAKERVYHRYPLTLKCNATAWAQWPRPRLIGRTKIKSEKNRGARNCYILTDREATHFRLSDGVGWERTTRGKK